jgi:hypothetical protein
MKEIARHTQLQHGGSRRISQPRGCDLAWLARCSVTCVRIQQQFAALDGPRACALPRSAALFGVRSVHGRAPPYPRLEGGHGNHARCC